MLLDEEMDHGPLLAQKKVPVPEWPPHAEDLEELLARAGVALLADILPLWVAGDIEPQHQNHDVATYSQKFAKSDAQIDLSADPYQNLLKIRAYEGWPVAYTYFEKDGKKIRVQIIDAHIENSALILDTVKPEGKKEMPYSQFLQSGAK